MIKGNFFPYDITHRNLYFKYGDIKEENDKMYINSLIYSKKSHYLSEYKDQKIFSYIDEFLKRIYKKKESFVKLPKISVYYKNYLNFFCRPFYRNFFYNNILQSYGDNKAEIFYKKNYCSNNSLEKKYHNDNFNTIFDSTARKLIDDNNILTTIDLCTIHSNNKSDDIFQDDFFTIKTQGDGFIDVLKNLTKNSYRNNERESVAPIQGTMYIEDQEKGKKRISAPNTSNNTYIKSITNSKNKSHSNVMSSSKSKSKNKKKTITSPKSSMCNLYKKNQFFNNKSMHHLLFTNNNTKDNKSNNQCRLYSPSFSSKSNLAQFKKCKPLSKSKNSFNVKSNITDIFKYKNSFKHSISNYSNSNIVQKSNCVSCADTNKKSTIKQSIDYKNTWNKQIKPNSYKKSSASKTNRNKGSTSPKGNIIMTYLTNCISNQVNSNTNVTIKESNVKHKNKIFSLRGNLSTHTSAKGSKSKKHNPLILNYFNKVPIKGITTKNSTNTSKIMKSNQSLDTIFSKKKKKSNKSSTNNNSLTKKNDINLNVNVNLNNIHININTNENIMTKNSSHSNMFKRGSLKDKTVSQEMEKFINGIRSNLNSNRVVNEFIYINKKKGSHHESIGAKNKGKQTMIGSASKGRNRIKKI